MGHFICVQNLLLSCGQAPHLGYGKWTDTQFRPFPFKLELVFPLAREVHIVEQPDIHIDPAQRADLGRISEDALLSAGQHVEPFRVGLLYAKIYWLLRPSDEELANPTMEPWSGFPVKETAARKEHAGRHVREGFIINASARNAVGRHWKGTHDTMIVKAIADRPSALALVAEVSAQGEGFGSPRTAIRSLRRGFGGTPQSLATWHARRPSTPGMGGPRQIRRPETRSPRE